MSDVAPGGLPPVGRRALGRTLVGAGVVGLVAVVAMLVTSLRGDDAPVRAGRVDLQIRPVLEVRPTSDPSPGELTPACEPGPVCPGVDASDEIVLEDSAGTRYRLGPAVLSADGVATARPSGGAGGSWSVVLRLTDEGRRSFGELTSEAVRAPPPGNRIAIVIDGALASVPTVAAPVTSGDVAIVGDFDAASAASLATRLAAGGVT